VATTPCDRHRALSHWPAAPADRTPAATDDWKRSDLARALAHGPSSTSSTNLASGGSLWTAAVRRGSGGSLGVLELLDRLYGKARRAPLWLLCPAASSGPELGQADAGKTLAPRHPAGDATPDHRLDISPGQGRVEAPRKLAGATPPRPRRPKFEASLRMPTTTPPTRTANLLKDLASDFVLRLWRSLQAGAWRAKTCVSLSNCCRLPSKPCATSAFDANTTAFRQRRAPEPDLDDCHCRG